MKKVLLFKYINDGRTITDIEFFYVTLIDNSTIELFNGNICSKTELLESHHDMFIGAKCNQIHHMDEHEELNFVLDKLSNESSLNTEENIKSIKYFVKYNYLEEIRRHETFMKALKDNQVMF